VRTGFLDKNEAIPETLSAANGLNGPNLAQPLGLFKTHNTDSTGQFQKSLMPQSLEGVARMVAIATLGCGNRRRRELQCLVRT